MFVMKHINNVVNGINVAFVVVNVIKKKRSYLMNRDVAIFFLKSLRCLDDTRLVGEEERKKEMFYLTTHSTHFIYGYMASDIW